MIENFAGGARASLRGYGGNVSHALASEAQRWNAVQIALGASHHHGLLRWVEGTVSEFVTDHTPCSILIVPSSYVDQIHTYPRRILFAFDGSETSFNAPQSGLHPASPDSLTSAVYVVDRAVRFIEDTN
jgi:nucleotide-binding universal stress UspA family protein